MKRGPPPVAIRYRVAGHLSAQPNPLSEHWQKLGTRLLDSSCTTGNPRRFAAMACWSTIPDTWLSRSWRHWKNRRKRSCLMITGRNHRPTENIADYTTG